MLSEKLSHPQNYLLPLIFIQPANFPGTMLVQDESPKANFAEMLEQDFFYKPDVLPVIQATALKH